MKIQAFNITDTSFEVRCPKCKTLHKFNKKGFNEIYLIDQHDTFTMDQDKFLYPFFVCTNFRCDFVDRIQLEEAN